MITQNYHQLKTVPQLLERYANIEDILFFDIETTGLSPDSSFIYLISYGYYKNNEFYLTQLFAENMSDEVNVLDAFDKVLPSFALLVQFNGNRFDIPYVKARYNYHNMCSHIACLEYFDIYLYTKEFKRLFDIPNCKLKTFEKLLKIRRKDLIDGGEAIDEYYNYVSTGDTASLNACLLHNYEDVLNLPDLSMLIIFEHLKNLSGFNYNTYSDQDYFIIEADAGQCINISITLELNDLIFEFIGNKGKIKFKKINGKIKLHFKDYKNYCYLETEKYAIEKTYAKRINLKGLKNCNIDNAYQYIEIDNTQLTDTEIKYLWNESYNWILLYVSKSK